MVTAPLTRRQRNDADPGGLIVIDKPAGISSHDVVAKVRKIVGSRKVGHGGTLDPMATGVLVVAVNRSTRLLAHLALTVKVYEATIRLGETTDTDDADGTSVTTASCSAVTEQDVRSAIVPLTGDIEQVPSAVSAIKVDGKRAYQLVREGRDVELAPRPVTVSRFDVLDVRRPTADLLDVDVRVECSSGTYIRALARDLGSALGVGGHLTSLRRVRVGPFGVDRARTLEELATLPEPVELPLAEAIRVAFPVREISVAEADTLSYGQFLVPAGIVGTYGAIDTDGRAVGLLYTTSAGRPGPESCSSAAADGGLSPSHLSPRDRSSPAPVGCESVQRWDGLDDIPDAFGPCVVTIGVFDGVHRGHAALIARAVEAAHGRGVPCVVMTFDPHPLAVVAPDHAPAMLASIEHRLDLLGEVGVDAALVLRFTPNSPI